MARSVSRARILDLISEGEIVGLLNGAAGIRLDGVPVQNPDGSYNFSGFSFEARNGAENQDYFHGFSNVENEIQIGTKLTKEIPRVISITNENIDSIRVTINFPALFLQSTSGSILYTAVDLAFYVKKDNGNFFPYALSKENISFYSSSYTSFDTVTPLSPPSTVEIHVGYYNTKDSRDNELMGFIRETKIYYRRDGGEWILYDTFEGNYSRFFGFLFRNVTIAGLQPGVYQVKIESKDPNMRLNQVSAGVPRYRETISNKATSTYAVSFIIPKPANVEKEWQVKIERLTNNSDSLLLQNESWIKSYTEIIEHKLNYPSCAVVGITLDAEQFGTAIMSRQYEVKGIKVKVPANYNPETREYIGLWDGTFKTAWSDNPAWILYDLLTNTRYGLGKKIPENSIDKVGLYEIAKYNDQFVSDGYTGQEPRYRFNGVISVRKSAYELINFISSTFHCMVYVSNGKIFFTQDSPSQVRQIFHPGNVVEGEFIYTSASEKTAYSAVYVTWNNPSDNYAPLVEIVNNDLLAVQGVYNTKEVVAYGCTSRGQARRYGRWLLEAEREAVSFKTGIENVLISPGDIIEINDPNYSGLELAGRIVSATKNSLTIDIEIELKENFLYTLIAELSDGTLIERQVTNPPGKYKILYVEVEFSDIPKPFYSWGVQSGNLAPRLFRVVNIIENDSLSYEVQAVYHDKNKYDRIENGVLFQDNNFSIWQPNAPVEPPTNLTASESIYQTVDGFGLAVTLGWTPPNDQRVISYEIEMRDYSSPSGGFVSAGYTNEITKEMKGLTPGKYDFRARSIVNATIKSDWATIAMVLQGTSLPPDDIKEFRIVLLNESAYLEWSPISAIDNDKYEIRYSPEVVNVSWSGATFLQDVPNGTTRVSIPPRSGTYLIKAVDVFGNYSVNAVYAIDQITNTAIKNIVKETKQEPGFNGTFENTKRVPNALYQNTVQLSTKNDTIDKWTSLDKVILLNYGEEIDFYNEGHYEFDSPVDLGSVFRCKLVAFIKAYGLIVDNFLSTWPELSELKTMENAPDQGWSSSVQFSTSLDNLSWTSYTELQAGEIAARYFKFRIKMTSSIKNLTPVISSANVVIDLPDRSETKTNINCPVEGLLVKFNYPFKEKPWIGINAQSLLSQDKAIVENETRESFKITFVDSQGQSVSRNFDYHAIGYGQEY